MPRRFLPSLRRKAAPADLEHKIVAGDYYGELVSSGLWSPARARPWPVERAVEEGYSRIVWVFKAVEAIAANAARLPYRVKDGEEVLDDHPLYRVLNGRANPLETGREFRKRLMAQVLLSKAGAFVEVTSSNGGDIARLDLLPPGRTRPVPGRNGVLIDHFELSRADGTLRQIEPDRVRWFREPHPTDPFSGITPLEAAGMSAELDYFARLYNVSFLKNDGRPGGVLAINGEMDPREMDRIEHRFRKGPTEAGNLTVINGEVSYVDLAARPRDVQYESLSKIAKNEVLCAFGTPESILGYAADRSYSNAEQEQLNFWQVTMPPWLDLLATTLDGDTSDDLVGFFDTSSIEVLQRAEANRREEARKEFELGLISVNEYRDRAGYDDVDRPRARALYIPSGKQVVATSEADQKAIDKEDMDKLPPEFIVNARNPAAATNNGQGNAPGRGGAQPTQPLRPVRNAPRPVRAVNQPRGASGVPGGRAVAAKAHPAEGGSVAHHARPPVMRLERPRRHKVAALSGSHSSGDGESDPDPAARDRLEGELAAVLHAVGERMVARTVARLRSPKHRKGTRHWLPDAGFVTDQRSGVKALDAPRIVDEDRWAAEAEAAAEPVLDTAAGPAAAAVLAALGAGTGRADSETLRRLPTVLAELTRMVGGAARRTAERLTRLVNDADQEGLPVDQVAETVAAEAARVRAAFSGIARQAATALLAAARDAAAQAAAETEPGLVVDRMWRTRRDDKVRRTHRKAHGQHQPVGSPFVVGGALLRFPGDPFGPPGEVRECRCGISYRARHTGRFTVRPAEDLDVAAPA